MKYPFGTRSKSIQVLRSSKSHSVSSMVPTKKRGVYTEWRGLITPDVVENKVNNEVESSSLATTMLSIKNASSDSILTTLVYIFLNI